MNDGISPRFELAQQAARQAGRLLADNLQNEVRVSKKGRINLVTEMDLASEKLILDRISSRFADDDLLSEEEGHRPGSAERRWIIDPLDGTTNYAHGYRFFCVSIAFEWRGQIEFGVVYDPVADEMYTARSGAGAHLNGRPIRVSREETLVGSLLCTGFPYDQDLMKEGLELFGRVLMQARGIRRDGAAALDLCMVAAGRFEGFWEKGLNAWDVAAGDLIVREAGGRTSHADGSPHDVYRRWIVASNGLIHADLLAALNAPPGAFGSANGREILKS